MGIEMTKNATYLVLNSDVHSPKRPTIRGTRITIDDILSYVSAGWSADKIAHELKIPKAAVLESLTFVSKIVKEVNVIG